ncbi:ketoacyl-ACP synthase III [Vibrio marisflavi]|uniref:Beta-ketoacyl-[acyl-carrier-protein] synthase III n=1 Tax=Vibrio marisflavi CECT 7928 TaxID=634439 RepID=A0ABN8E0X2_9VIBR|nr:ketoacyl-ACP synthase III [Vibrio marisflavi]CAH0536538.1 3-oxoacyl-[acyl-carrier-protein] synthase 3 protein 2 [Vibrio marisflavi CECT 7928]
MKQYYAEITGWGKCIPPTVLTNEDLSTFLDTSDEWIKTRTGIEQRCISHVDTSDLATVAAQNAIACAGISVKEIDLVIVATCSADSQLPNVASHVAKNLSIEGAAAFDLNAACTGFLYGLETATRLIQAGNYRNVVVIGAERLSYYIDWSQRDTAVLFGDGAGAAVLSRTEKQVGLQQSKIGCDSEAREILAVSKLGTSMDRFAADNGLWDFNFVGKEIFKRAVKGMGAAAETVLTEAGLSTDNIDIVVPHQANIRIIQTLCDMSGIERDKAFVNIQNYGNTSAATVPIALCEALEQGKVEPNSNMLIAAFGAGLTWGAGIVKWGERVTPLAQPTACLPSCDKSALELLQVAIEKCTSGK